MRSRAGNAAMAPVRPGCLRRELRLRVQRLVCGLREARVSHVLVQMDPEFCKSLSV